MSITNALCNNLRTALVNFCFLEVFMTVTNVALENRMDTYRLPSAIIPLQYNLTIEPNFGNLNKTSFNGSVIIRVKVVEETNFITLHSRNLSIARNDVEIIFENQTIVHIMNITVDAERDFYTITLFRSLAPNSIATIYINQFRGDLNFDNVGFYLAKYRELDKERLLAVTDFQPISARKAFPCFDEPALKATFRISIIRQTDFISLSNDELLETRYLGSDRYKDEYKETVPMSTYIVAFSVSKYRPTVKNGRFQIYGTRNLILSGNADYELSIAENILGTLENLTTVEYQLTKMDLLVIPVMYFEPGGMENWGLITIGDADLEISNETTAEDVQKSTLLFTHELVHQWFGNLVTPSWWNYVWLSEGFSTYMEYYITSLINPSWEVMHQFVVNLLQLSLQNDGLHSDHLNQNKQDVKELLSDTAYHKGAVILRMLEHVLTPQVFRLGFTTYLKKHKFASVSPRDLYEALQNAVEQNNVTRLGGLKVNEIMKSWESYPGYPLIEVVRNYTNASINVTQYPYGDDMNKENHIWIVPITYVCGGINLDFNDTSPNLWLTDQTTTIQNILSNCTWILFNKQQAGYYRVNYDLRNWNSLIDFLKTPYFKEIHTINRAQLIDDAFELAQINSLPYEIPLNLSLYLFQEKDYAPMASFLKKIRKQLIWYIHTKEYKAFSKYIEVSLHSAYSSLGFDEKLSDTHIDTINRANIISWLCKLGNTDCQIKALLKLRKWSQDGCRISKELELPIICTALNIGTTNDWNFVYDKYQVENDAFRQARLFTALGCTKNEELLNKYYFRQRNTFAS